MATPRPARPLTLNGSRRGRVATEDMNQPESFRRNLRFRHVPVEHAGHSSLVTGPSPVSLHPSLITVCHCSTNSAFSGMSPACHMWR